MPLAPRAGESLPEHVARFRATEAKKRELQKLKAWFELEKQLNRKVELNAVLSSVITEPDQALS
jgi:hypothetical protein